MRGGACLTSECRCQGYVRGDVIDRCADCGHADIAHEHVRSRGAPPAWLLSPITWLTVGLVALGIAFGVSLDSNRHAAEHAATAAADAAAAKAIAEGERNARLAEKRAGIEATFQACKRSIPTFKKVNRFVNDTAGGWHDLLLNAIANHEATPPDNPQFHAQIGNIARLRRRVASAQAVVFPAPTEQKCRERRAEDLKALAAAEKPGPPAPG